MDYLGILQIDIKPLYEMVDPKIVIKSDLIFQLQSVNKQAPIRYG